MRRPTKDELATNLYRAWYLALCSPVDSLYMPFIESTLRRHYGDDGLLQMVREGIPLLEANGSPVPAKFREMAAPQPGGEPR